MSERERADNPVTSTCNRPSSGGLPTIEYVGQDGVRRELDFQRAPHAPWRALLVESEESNDGMRHVGTEQLRDLRVDGEARAAVSLANAFEGP